MENKKTHEELNTLVIISKDRERTNLLKKYEQKTIAYLVERIPEFISSDMLTGIGLFGNVIIFGSFILAHFLHPYYLLIGVLVVKI